MNDITYQRVDVFTDVPFGGNPLAVFPMPGDLTTQQMQTIAREMNLSETVFVYPPEAPTHHAHLRIFTPQIELPFAGHPTIGTGYVLYHLGTLPAPGTYQLEEGVGPITVQISPTASGATLVTMQQPVPQFGAQYEDRHAIAEMLALTTHDLLELPLQVVSAGVPFLFVPVRTLEAMREIRLRLDLWERHLKTFVAPHVFAFCPEVVTPGAAVHSRMFAPLMGIAEDPATGAASGPLGAYLLRYGLVTPAAAAHLISEQGIEMGRPSFIHIHVTGTPDHIQAVSIGGLTQPVGQGVMRVPAV